MGYICAAQRSSAFAGDEAMMPWGGEQSYERSGVRIKGSDSLILNKRVQTRLLTIKGDVTLYLPCETKMTLI